MGHTKYLSVEAPTNKVTIDLLGLFGKGVDVTLTVNIDSGKRTVEIEYLEGNDQTGAHPRFDSCTFEVDIAPAEPDPEDEDNPRAPVRVDPEEDDLFWTYKGDVLAGCEKIGHTQEPEEAEAIMERWATRENVWPNAWIHEGDGSTWAPFTYGPADAAPV